MIGEKHELKVEGDSKATWQLEWDMNLQPSGRKAPNLPLSHTPRVIKHDGFAKGPNTLTDWTELGITIQITEI